MWKYLQNAKPPPQKRKMSTEEKLEKGKEYDQNKRKRGYSEEWRREFAWLDIDENNNKMYCKTCKVYEAQGTFVTGCSNFKKDTLVSHDKSKGHQRNSRIYVAQNSKPGTSVAEKSLVKLNTASFNKLCILFRTAHALAKNGRPYRDFEWILDLLEALGMDIGKTYRNNKKASEFIHAIATCTNTDIVQKFEKASYFSVISDGATDSSHQEAEILYMKLCIEGEILTYFLGIRNVKKADAQNIVNVIIKLLNDFFGDDWLKKLIGTATDGASVMLGSSNGVVKRLKEHTGRDFVYVMHCSAHRLELSYKDACKNIVIYKKVETLLQNLYLFYRNSPLNRANLKEAYSTFENRTPLLPVRAGGTRWVAHVGRAIGNIVGGYGPIIAHLSQLQNPDDRTTRGESVAKAKNFLKLLKSKDILCFMHFLWDVVQCLSQVSLCFQASDSTVADVYEEIEAAKAVLKTYEESDGPKLASVVATEVFDGQELHGTRNELVAGKRKLLKQIQASLDKRFQTSDKVLKATSIARLSTYPSNISDDPGFGDKEVKILLEHFKPALVVAGIADPDTIQPEWTRFKTLLYNCFDDVHTVTWKEVNSRLKQKCTDVLNLVDLILTLPSSSAEAERGFSKMKLVKNDWRSSLKDTSLSDLLTVIMETPDIKDFNPTDSVHYWLAAGQRQKRTECMDEKKPVTVNTLPAAVQMEGSSVTQTVETDVQTEPIIDNVDTGHAQVGMNRVLDFMSTEVDSDLEDEEELIREEEAEYEKLKEFIY